jgi:putative hydrolase of the HAD superfamily
MLDRIRTVSLDLDDTLWETLPVLERAELSLLAWLDERWPRLGTGYGRERFRAERLAIARDHPDLAHDMTWLRTESLRRAAAAVGYPESVAGEAFEVFIAARNEIEPYPDVRPALARLAAALPVYALTNGNACVRRVGLGEFFRDAIAPHVAGAAKPDPRIFRHLVECAAVPPEAILHVGDDPVRDVEGARSVGLRTAWMNRGGEAWDARLAPADYQVASLAELADLVLGPAPSGAHVEERAQAAVDPLEDLRRRGDL